MRPDRSRTEIGRSVRPVPRFRTAIVVSIALLAAVPAFAFASGPTSTAVVPFVGTGPTRAAGVGPLEVAPGYQPASGVSAIGALPAQQSLAVAVGLASRDPSGLAAWDAASAAPGTPEYRHPLTASEAASRFGAAPATVRAAEAYFRQFNLSVNAAPDGLLLNVEGPSSGVARAFGTTFELYRGPDGREFYSHPTPATLPAAIDSTGALGLGNVTPIEPEISSAAPIVGSSPAAGCASGDGGSLLPCSIDGAYEITPLLTNGTNGSGETIAVVDAYTSAETQSDFESDLATFAAEAGIPVGQVEYLYPDTGGIPEGSNAVSPLWGTEAALDLEWARATAPGATIALTLSPNSGPGLYEAIDWLVANRAADVISLSWGEPDVGVYNAFSGACTAGCNASSDGSYALLGPVLELATAEGISVFAASGDCGSADGTSGVATNFPASDPYVTGVGGTVLSVSGGVWDGEVGWSGNQSGASPPGCGNGGGSGGGYAPFPEPWWQSGLPSGRTNRGVPDVAMDADTPVAIVYGGSSIRVTGTSVGTPIWAGIAAIADQSAGGDLGLLNPALYRILGSARYADDFHDIVSGSNGYHARVGWDPVTGIGTPIVDHLVEDLAAGGGIAGGDLATFVSATPTSGAAPLKVTFAIAATGGTGAYPLEGVSFGDSNSSLTGDGTVVYTYATPGVYSAQSFVVDTSGNSSVSPPLPIVVGGGSLLTVTLLASTTSPSVGAPVTFRADATGGTAPYTYNFSFGDGAYAGNLSSASATYAYPVAGLFCAVVVVSDAASPPDGGASLAAEISAGGASGPACGNATPPLSVTPVAGVGERDAPAEFPALFNVSGGVVGNGYPPPTISLVSTDPYVVACDCLIFRNPGTYTVAEVATDALGARANNSTTVTVAPPLVGTFSASTLAGPVPLAVTFSAAASGGDRANASRTVWTIGANGPTEVGASVDWTFSTPGEYLVTADLEDAGDGNASEAFVLDAEPSSGVRPVGVTGTVTPSTDVPSGTTVRFTGAVVGAEVPVSLFWSFAEGASAVGPSANETFYNVPAPPDDALGFELLAEGPGYAAVGAPFDFDLASFFAREAGGFEPSADALSMAAGAAPLFGAAPLPVDGTGSATGPGGATLAWQFGPLGTGSGSSPRYSFATAGNYTVVATATDPYGDRAVASTAVAVTRPLTVVASVSADHGTAPLTISFAAAARGGDDEYLYLWTLGTGAVAIGPSGTVAYDAPGSYRVTLEVSDAHFQTAAENWTITVAASPVYPAVVLGGGAAAGLLLAVVLGRDGRRRSPVSP